MKIAPVKTVRYYSNGQKMMVIRDRYETRGEYVHLTNIEENFWSPDGARISRAEMREHRANDPLANEPLEPDNELPFRDFIYWWNDW